MRQNKKRLVALCMCFFIGILGVPNILYAQSASPNYRIEESYFGTGGEVDASSSNYRARQSTGSLGVGSTSGAGFDAVAGATTPSEPFLEAAIMGPDIDLGIINPDTTSYAASQGGACNCTFYVRSYLSSGYAVVTGSTTLTSESNSTIDAKTTQGAPSTDKNVEEFGINLVANTTLASFGANPVNEPDDSFADGKPAAGYNTPDQYKYNQGDVIATSPATTGNQGVGRTNFTISYIAKSANMTPAGTYKMKHDIIVVPTF
jgi:hypothetical protein